MCGEWEFGGLPAWILENGTIALRTYAFPYISHVESWWKELLPKLQPLLYSRGGPVVMVQVENEFGSYGDVSTRPADKQYLEHLIAIARAYLNDTILFTTDGGDTGYMSRGSLKGGDVYTVGDGCGNPQTCWDAQKAFNPPGMSPNMCSEFYTGWLTHWGEAMANTSAAGVASSLEAILSTNGSVSLYMAHGGTNFGGWSGANGDGGSSFQPHVTSYDYDSPLSEGGNHGFGSDGGDKFKALQSVFKKYWRADADGAPSPPPEPAPLPLKAFGRFSFSQTARLLSPANLEVISNLVASEVVAPQPVEKYGPSCYYGLILYSTTLDSDYSNQSLTIGDVRDRVQVFVSDGYYGTLYRVTPGTAVELPSAPKGALLQLLVENMGRINFGHGMDDTRKGIIGDVLIAGNAIATHGGWTTRCIDLDPERFSRLVYETYVPTSKVSPAFYRASVDIAVVADTYLRTDGWTKGYAWVNGHALGRYWPVQGPQRTLFVPAPFFDASNSTVALFTVLELHHPASNASASLVDAPDFSGAASARCDASAFAGEASLVVMDTLSDDANTGTNQHWQMGADGSIRLGMHGSGLCVSKSTSADPLTGTSAIVLGQCAGSDVLYFDYVADPTKPSTMILRDKASKNCLDIFSHDALDLAPLDLYACIGNEDNQRWTVSSDSTISSSQPIQSHRPFVLTACTPSSHHY